MIILVSIVQKTISPRINSKVGLLFLIILHVSIIALLRAYYLSCWYITIRIKFILIYLLLVYLI